jgi:predicted RNase H-like HicB family nuclease
MEKTLTYQAVFERSEDGSIWGYSPEVPGATGAGGTLDEARLSLRRGIELWIGCAREKGESIPIPSEAVSIESITVSAAGV